MISRIINIKKELKPGKILIIYGPRQAGKTTLVKQFLDQTDLKYQYTTGDDLQLAAELSKCTQASTDNFVGNYELTVIDEAQRINNIGLALKMMVDNYPERYFITTGSSSFDLASQTAESLTGRKNVIELYPIAQLELAQELSNLDLIRQKQEFLIYGSYPEIINQQLNTAKEETIRQITNSYLLKDVFAYSGIKNSNKILQILKLLAFQIGSQVSVAEISRTIGLEYQTVVNYLDLLEKSFVIFALNGFSRNLRKEVTKMPKYYFYDTGIRNAIISNFNQVEDRNDIGQLWENFLIIERIKRNSYKKIKPNYNFWRTYDQKEIDLIEEHSGQLSGYEFKWNKKQTKAPQLWLKTYQNAVFDTVNQNNYLEFVT